MVSETTCLDVLLCTVTDHITSVNLVTDSAACQTCYATINDIWLVLNTDDRKLVSFIG